MSFSVQGPPPELMPVVSSQTVVGATSVAGELYQPTNAERLPVSCSKSCAEKSHSGLKVAGSVPASAFESSTPAPLFEVEQLLQPHFAVGVGQRHDHAVGLRHRGSSRRGGEGATGGDERAERAAKAKSAAK